MASRCSLSNWQIDFVGDRIKEGKQIDFVFYKDSKQNNVAGVECSSNRYRQRYSQSDLTIEKINRKISEKAKKFKNIKKLGISLDERLLIIDITTVDYAPPRILKDLYRTKKAVDWMQ